jgi:uroporphyrinogen decarboxylase
LSFVLNKKELFLSATKYEATPRLPVMLLSSGVWEVWQSKMSLQDLINLSPSENAEFIIKANQIENMDVIWTAPGCNNLLLKAIGSDISFDKVGSPSEIVSSHFNSVEIIEKINMDAIENSREIFSLLEATRKISQEVGDEILIGISQWGAFTLAGLLFGLSGFLKICMKDKIAARYVLDFTSKLAHKYLNLFSQAGAELISQSLPYINRVNTDICGNVKVKMLHICGNTTKILDNIPDAGVDIFSVDYKVDLTEAKKALAGKVALAGNLNPVGILLEGTAENVKKKAEESCIAAGNGGGFILMPGCDLPAAAPLENVRSMVEAAYNYMNDDV